MNDVTTNAVVSETIEEVTNLEAPTHELPPTQVVSAEGIAEQSDDERNSEVKKAIAEAHQLIDAIGHNGFILVSMAGDGTARAMLAGDYPTVVHGVHTALCALGGIVKQIQGQADGNPEKHAGVEDFTAGASVVTIHHGMLAKMHTDAVDEAQAESVGQTQQ